MEQMVKEEEIEKMILITYLAHDLKILYFCYWLFALLDEARNAKKAKSKICEYCINKPIRVEKLIQ